MKKIISIILIIFSFFVFASSVFAQTVTNVSGSVIHSQNITISGSGFGVKSPAAPLMWDDGEGSAVDSDSAVKDKGWSEVWPIVGVSSPTEVARIRYRTAGIFRNVAAPHSRSLQYIAGSHYQESPYNWANTLADSLAGYPGYNDPSCSDGHAVGYGGCTSGNALESTYRGVALTKDSGVADKTIWFVHFYHRLDPNWSTTHLDNLNHKFLAINTGPGAYDGNNKYQSWAGGDTPEQETGSDSRMSGGNILCGRDANPWMPGNGNPRLNWLKFEVQTKIGTGPYRKVFVDGVAIFDSDDPYLAGYCAEDWLAPTRSFTIGGYWRRATGTGEPNWSYRGDVNNYRYYDDIYMDNTFSRVVLANNQNYDRAIIVEPQIPSAWSGNSISTKINLGKLPDSGTAYLFVFDSNNEHNAVGYPVTLGSSGGDTTPPAAPTGVVIQ